MMVLLSVMLLLELSVVTFVLGESGDQTPNVETCSEKQHGGIRLTAPAVSPALPSSHKP